MILVFFSLVHVYVFSMFQYLDAKQMVFEEAIERQYNEVSDPYMYEYNNLLINVHYFLRHQVDVAAFENNN